MKNIALQTFLFFCGNVIFDDMEEVDVSSKMNRLGKYSESTFSEKSTPKQ